MPVLISFRMMPKKVEWRRAEKYFAKRGVVGGKFRFDKISQKKLIKALSFFAAI